MIQNFKTIVFYKGNGELTFNFPFNYLKKSFIHVKLLPVPYSALDVKQTEPLRYGTDYTIEERKVRLKSQLSTQGKTVCIYRNTTTENIVEFNDSSFLKASNLNTFDIQVLHLSEELADTLLLYGRELNDENDVQGIRLVSSLPSKAVNADMVILKDTKHIYQYFDNKWNKLSSFVDYADKAHKDNQGNVIDTTYATKKEVADNYPTKQQVDAQVARQENYTNTVRTNLDNELKSTNNQLQHIGNLATSLATSKADKKDLEKFKLSQGVNQIQQPCLWWSTPNGQTSLVVQYAKLAGSAGNTTSDAKGNIIDTTYATKAEVEHLRDYVNHHEDDLNEVKSNINDFDLEQGVNKTQEHGLTWTTPHGSTFIKLKYAERAGKADCDVNDNLIHETYITKKEADTKYPTKGELEEKINKTQKGIDTNYPTRQEVADLVNGYCVSKEQADTAIANIKENMSTQIDATKQQVGEILSKYYLPKEETEERFSTKAEVNDKLTKYATKEDLKRINVPTINNGTSTIDTSIFVTKGELEDNLTSNYVNKTDLKAYAVKRDLNDLDVATDTRFETTLDRIKVIENDLKDKYAKRKDLGKFDLKWGITPTQVPCLWWSTPTGEKPIEINYAHEAAKANKDGEGNVISQTYATQAEFGKQIRGFYNFVEPNIKEIKENCASKKYVDDKLEDRFKKEVYPLSNQLRAYNASMGTVLIEWRKSIEAKATKEDLKKLESKIVSKEDVSNQLDATKQQIAEVINNNYLPKEECATKAELEALKKMLKKAFSG